MIAFPKVDMTEAAHLTREGRLHEAMAVLRRVLHGRRSDRRPAEPEAGAIDMVAPAEATGSWAQPQFGSPRSSDPSAGVRHATIPEALRSLLARAQRSGIAGDLNTPVRPPFGRSVADLPDGASFEERVYSNAAGSRVYRLYVPGGYHDQPMPLVVMLHGCTQSPDDFAAGTRMNNIAEEQPFLVAYPAQSQSANASKCWNWFNAADQRRDRGEPSLIAGITRQVMHDFAVDAGRVYIAGLSAGGAAAAIMGDAYPDLYAAIGVHSGLACGAATDLASAFTAMRQGGSPTGGLSTSLMPTIVFHGDRDATVNPVNGAQIISRSMSEAARTAINRGETPGGVGFTRIVHSDDRGRPVLEHWLLHGVGHAWSGGSGAGSYTEPRGPDASREMIRFFLQHKRRPV